jgi:CheY-like chemotaxis protein
MVVAASLLILLVPHREVIDGLLGRISKLKVYKFELDTAEKSVQQLPEGLPIESLPNPSEKSKKGKESSSAALSDQDQKQLIRRIRSIGTGLAGSRVLWVDDHPESLVLERRSLQLLGVVIEMAQSNQSAVSLMKKAKESGLSYQLVISDVNRDPVDRWCDQDKSSKDKNETRGFELLTQMRSEGIVTPTIFYTHSKAAKPPEAYDMTRSTALLFNDIFNVLDRAQK